MDTRDLIKERENLKQQILDSFLENFPQYEDMPDTFEDIRFEYEEIKSWKECWEHELKEIEEINELENEVGREWDYGVTLISEDDFEEYCEDFCEEVGYVSSDLPAFIRNNIDWAGVAEEMEQDFSAVEFRGTTYLFRG